MANCLDNCPSVVNPLQADTDDNGIGDPCEPPRPEPSPVAKNRYVTFAPANGPTLVAFQITHEASGRTWWVNGPQAVTGLADLAGTPVYRAWSEPVVHAGGCGIVPDATYEVRSIPVGEETGLPLSYSAPLLVSTTPRPWPKVWGDTNGPFTLGNWSGPDGLVNFTDIAAVVQRFQNSPTAPPLSWVDLSPEEPNGIANFGDINGVVTGFQGLAYPYSLPVACP